MYLSGKKIFYLKTNPNKDVETKVLLNKVLTSYKTKEDNSLVLEDSEIYLMGKRILITGVPHIAKGDELYEDVLLMTAIEKRIRDTYGSNLPSKIDFESLL